MMMTRNILIGFGAINLIITISLWFSLSARIEIYHTSNGLLMSTLDSNEEVRLKQYSDEQKKTLASVLETLDKNRASIEQNQKYISQVVDQNKTLLEDSNRILNQHSKSIKHTEHEAEVAASNSSKAVKAVVKPTPKPWWHWGK